MLASCDGSLVIADETLEDATAGREILYTLNRQGRPGATAGPPPAAVPEPCLSFGPAPRPPRALFACRRAIPLPLGPTAPEPCCPVATVVAGRVP